MNILFPQAPRRQSTARTPSRSALVALALVLIAPVNTASAAKKGPRIYDATSLADLEELAGVLRRHVAHLRVEVDRPRGQQLVDPERDGYGIVISDRHIAALVFLFDDARGIEVAGPNGSPIGGTLVVRDRARRVAIVETEQPLATVGLSRPEITPKKEWKREMDVFALVAAVEGAGVVHGTMTDIADLEEYEGHPRIDLVLERGMPVFDAKARFVGYARKGAWDIDRFMLVPPDLIFAAKTATASAAKDERKEESMGSRFGK